MELRKIERTLWKWAWLIILATAVAGVSSWWVVKDQPPIYQTSTTLMIGTTIEQVSPDYSEFYTAQQLAQTYSELVKREPVLKATAAALGFEESWRNLRGQISAALVQGTQLMEIRVVDTDPVRAKRIADEIARQLMATVAQARPQGSSRQFIEQQVAILPAKIEAAEKEIAMLQAELGQTFSAREIQDLQSQINALERQVNDWRSTFAQYQLLLGNTGVNVLTVIEEAPLPTYPMPARKMLQVNLAAAVGLMLAVGAAFVMEYLDDTIKTPEDVEQRTHLPTFGVIVRFPRDEQQQLLTALHPSSSIAEGYRVLRTNLQFAAMGLGNSGTVLMVTSAQPTEGKSTTVANLGVSLAQAGKRVLLVDADLRRPSLHRLFNLSKDVGLTSLLLEREADVEYAARKTVVEGLRVLPSGPVPANPAEVLGFAEMGTLVERLRTMADYVLLDSPPVLNVADARVLAQHVDGVLMVAEGGGTRTEVFERAVAALQGVKARVLGAILTKVDVRRGPLAYDYYYYYSNYYTSGEGGVRRRRRQREGVLGQLDRLKDRVLGRKPRRHVPSSGVQAGAPSEVAAAAPGAMGGAAAEAGPAAEEAVGEALAVTDAAAKAGPAAEEAVREASAATDAAPEAPPGGEEVAAEVVSSAPAPPGAELRQADRTSADALAEADALYAEAMEHYRRREWTQAHKGLLRLKAIDPARPGLDALLKDAELLLQRERATQRAPRQKPQEVRRRSRALVGVALLGLLLLVGTGAGALVYTGVVQSPSVRLPFLDNRAQTYINRGYDSFTTDDYQAAIENFNKALELDPDNAEAKLGLQHATQYLELNDLYAEARALIERKAFEEAIGKLKAVIAVDPWYEDADLLLQQCENAQKLEALYQQAVSYYNNGEWAKAVDAFEGLQGKGVTAGEAEVRSKLFDSYLNEGRQQIAAADSRSAIIRATLHFNSALSLSPDNATVQEERQLASLYLSGFAAWEQGEWRQAISSLSRICAVRPDYARNKAARMLCESYIKLGDAYQANGQWQLALEQYRLAQTLTQCDQTEVAAKIQQVVAQLSGVTPAPTATP